MTKHFCDKCGREISRGQIRYLDAMEKPDTSGDNVEGGTTSHAWVFCPGCFKAAIAWLNKKGSGK